jgi:hypothetical protein
MPPHKSGMTDYWVNWFFDHFPLVAAIYFSIANLQLSEQGLPVC